MWGNTQKEKGEVIVSVPFLWHLTDAGIYMYVGMNDNVYIVWTLIVCLLEVLIVMLAWIALTENCKIFGEGLDVIVVWCVSYL